MVATANCTMIPRETFDWAAPATAAAWHAYLYIRARRRIAFGLGFPKLSTQIYINIFVRLYFRVAGMNAHPSCDRPRTRHLSFCYFIFFCGQRAWFWIKGCGVQLVSRPVVRPDQTSIPCAVHPLIRLCMLQWTLIHFFFYFHSTKNQKLCDPSASFHPKFIFAHAIISSPSIDEFDLSWSNAESNILVPMLCSMHTPFGHERPFCIPKIQLTQIDLRDENIS